jgi:hypothetical protein
MVLEVKKLKTETKRGNSIFLSYSNPGSATPSPLGLSSLFLNSRVKCTVQDSLPQSKVTIVKQRDVQRN